MRQRRSGYGGDGGLTDCRVFAANMKNHYCSHYYRHNMHKARRYIPVNTLPLGLKFEKKSLLTRLKDERAPNIHITAIACWFNALVGSYERTDHQGSGCADVVK